MYKRELIIVRHARSKYNMGETTELDAGITEFGQRQASNVGRFLQDKVDLEGYEAFTSPFLRCLETTEWMSQHIRVESRQRLPYALKFNIMSELREYLNHSGDSVSVPNRGEYQDGREYFPSYNWVHYPKEGETYKAEHNEEFLRRMHCAYQKLPEKSVVMTHGLPAILLAHVATENTHSVPVWDHSLDNCSVTYIINGRIVWWGRNLFHEVDYKPDTSKLREFDSFKVNKF